MCLRGAQWGSTKAQLSQWPGLGGVRWLMFRSNTKPGGGGVTNDKGDDSANQFHRHR